MEIGCGCVVHIITNGATDIGLHHIETKDIIKGIGNLVPEDIIG
jgi:hypothetical protein